MSSRDQQIMIKRAQLQAALSDDEYRDAIAMVSGMADCRSSKDGRLTDGHIDNLMAYMEAIYWRKVDLQQPCKAGAIFQQRGYWANKNQRGNTSRDRYVAKEKSDEATALENELHALGFGLAYVSAIQRNIQPFTMLAYVAALKRTLKAKQRAANRPF
jgi:hypothetical protein